MTNKNSFQSYSKLLNNAIKNINKIVKGKEKQIQIAISTIIAKGHLLIEDHPGVGKTTLAKTLASTFGMDFKRIQCTSDLLPGDLIGITYFNQKTREFLFKKGPVFTEFLLLDELNRAQPKTQSALLEAMEERQISHDLETYQLPDYYMVVATKNPYEEIGTFKLPLSQLDRFTASISLGHPDQSVEREILKSVDLSDKKIETIISIEQLIAIQELVPTITLSETILDEIQEIIAYTRKKDYFLSGISTRGAKSFVRLLQGYALVQGRDYVKPEDLRDTLECVLVHRIVTKDGKTVTQKDIQKFYEETDRNF
jgi:MoxR-like ATPase